MFRNTSRLLDSVEEWPSAGLLHCFAKVGCAADTLSFIQNGDPRQKRGRNEHPSTMWPPGNKIAITPPIGIAPLSLYLISFSHWKWGVFALISYKPLAGRFVDGFRRRSI